jgi:hypothetical protein
VRKTQVPMSIAYVAFAIIALVVIAALVRHRLSSQSGPDAQVIGQLRRAGSDLTKPHEIEFFLYFPSEVVARQAADQFSAQGYKAVVRLGAEQKDWLCLLTRHMVPTVGALGVIRSSGRINYAA